MSQYEVKPVNRNQIKPYIFGIHYAKRMPSVSYAYGLFLDDELQGIITYGAPASPYLCKGVCGDEYKDYVIELNRLCLKHNRPNEASRLVSGSLKLLPRPKIVVSYADSDQGHIGSVYQACNFLFTGTTRPRTDASADEIVTEYDLFNPEGVVRRRKLHSRHHKGDLTDRVNRSAKHRYIIFTGTKGQKSAFRRALNYQVLKYPKHGEKNEF